MCIQLMEFLKRRHLLLSATFAFYCMAIVVTYAAECDAYNNPNIFMENDNDDKNNNNNNNNELTTALQQQLKLNRAQAKRQQLDENLKLKWQEARALNELALLEAGGAEVAAQVADFNFVNLPAQPLQRQQQQHQQQQHASNDNKRADKNNENELWLALAEAEQNYYYHDNANSFNENNNNNENNAAAQQLAIIAQHNNENSLFNVYSNNKNNVNNNDDDDDADDDVATDNRNYVYAQQLQQQSLKTIAAHRTAHGAELQGKRGQQQQHNALATDQNSNNDFLWQLSALNEPVSYKSNSNNNNKRAAKNNNHAADATATATAAPGNKRAIDATKEHIAPATSDAMSHDNVSDIGAMSAATAEDLDTIDVYNKDDDNEDFSWDAAMAGDDDKHNLGINLPYGIQNVRKRTARSGPSLEYRSRSSTTFQSLCPTKRVSIPLETAGFEYRPNHYIEVTCAHNYGTQHSLDFNKNKICSEAGFSCIQLNRTIHLIRRNKAATVECWESEIRVVPSGCECMWPKHNFGDIGAYHDARKRFNVPQARGWNLRPGFATRQLELVGLDGTRREEMDGVGFDAYDFI